MYQVHVALMRAIRRACSAYCTRTIIVQNNDCVQPATQLSLCDRQWTGLDRSARADARACSILLWCMTYLEIHIKSHRIYLLFRLVTGCAIEEPLLLAWQVVSWC